MSDSPPPGPLLDASFLSARGWAAGPAPRRAPRAPLGPDADDAAPLRNRPRARATRVGSRPARAAAAAPTDPDFFHDARAFEAHVLLPARRARAPPPRPRRARGAARARAAAGVPLDRQRARTIVAAHARAAASRCGRARADDARRALPPRAPARCMPLRGEGARGRPVARPPPGARRGSAAATARRGGGGSARRPAQRVEHDLLKARDRARRRRPALRAADGEDAAKRARATTRGTIRAWAKSASAGPRDVGRGDLALGGARERRRRRVKGARTAGDAWPAVIVDSEPRARSAVPTHGPRGGPRGCTAGISGFCTPAWKRARGWVAKEHGSSLQNRGVCQPAGPRARRKATATTIARRRARAGDRHRTAPARVADPFRLSRVEECACVLIQLNVER